MAISSYKDFVVFPNDNSSRIYVNEQAFTASGTWTVPTGVASAQVILVGAGGGGGGGSRDVAGGGGGAGAVVVKNVTVTPGTTYQITVGAGGQGGQGAQVSATDVANTLPGSNGGASTFGAITLANLLTNAFFEYGAVAWDQNLIYRQVTGVNTNSTLAVFPNANGLSIGMAVQAITGIQAGTYISAISGNVLTLNQSLNNTVNGMVTFDINDTVFSQANVSYNAVSSSTVTANTQAVGSPASPYQTNLSNNLIAPRLSQLEDPTLVSSNYIRQYGTAFATLSITNAGLPGKLAEMVAPIAKTGTALNGATTLTVTDATNIVTGMYVSGTNIASGTTVLAVSGTTISLSSATTGAITSGAVNFSYEATVGQYALLCQTGSGVSAAAPSWIQLSTTNNTTNVTGTSVSSGYQAIPYMPGQTYTMSAYVSSNVNISTATPILFQLRSVGASYMAQNNQNYLGGTNSGTTSSIDAGQTNGFFVRQATPAVLPGYGGSVTANATASNGATTITVDNSANLLTGMSITGSGIQTNTVITTISGTSVGISLATNAVLSSTTLTFTNPSGVQILGSNVTVGQTGWRRISATFTTPAFATGNIGGTANGTYGYGSTPQFVYPVILFEQASSNIFVDNIQLEAGSSATSWLPPLYNNEIAALMTSNSTSTGNVESAHRFIKATAGTNYYGSFFALANGTSTAYRPVSAYLEFFDADYNSLSRTSGNQYALPVTGVATATQTNSVAATTHPVRLGVGVTAPAGTAYVRLGFSAYQAAQAASAIEYLLIAPQLEAALTASIFHRPNDGTYTFAGEYGNSQVVIGAQVTAEGGGGGGTYNSAFPMWQYGLEGANNGGHAANGSFTQPTLAGGGAGSTQAGGNALMYAPATTGSTTFNYAAGFTSSGGSALQTFPLRGHLGGIAIYHAGNIIANSMPAYSGDGGLGTVMSGLNSGSPLGISVAGGGGGAGWTQAAQQNSNMPGRGNAGGGKGGGNWIVSNTGLTNYYARGIDAVANTGSGGGGGASNQNNAPTLGAAHLASAALVYDTANANQYLWNPTFNCTTAIIATSAVIATNYLAITIQDVGNAKVQTGVSAFPILPRTSLDFTNVAARLTTAPAGVTSTQFPGLPKRVRPTVRWKTYDMQIIREDRPAYDIVFSATATITYLGPTGSTTGAWQTLQSPANAAYFDVTWECLYFDAGDQVDVDFAQVNYFPYISNGGNGADGYAVVRWFDKATF